MMIPHGWMMILRTRAMIPSNRMIPRKRMTPQEPTQDGQKPREKEAIALSWVKGNVVRWLHDLGEREETNKQERTMQQ